MDATLGKVKSSMFPKVSYFYGNKSTAGFVINEGLTEYPDHVVFNCRIMVSVCDNVIKTKVGYHPYFLFEIFQILNN